MARRTGPTLVDGLTLESVLDGLDDGVLVNDPDGRVLYVNPACAALLGYPIEQIVGRTVFDFADEGGPDAMRARLERRRQGQPDRFDACVIRPDGERVWVSIGARPAFNEVGVHIGSVVSLTDITARKRMETDLQRMHAELEARVAERTADLESTNRRLALEVVEREAAEEAARFANAQKNRFLANMSRELRTPLNDVIGYTELVLDDREAAVDEAAPDLVRVLAAGRHLLERINDLLDLSRMGAGQVEVRRVEVDVAAVVEEVCGLLEPRIRARGNQLHVEVPEAPVHWRTDPNKLRQILFNLLAAAARVTVGGAIRVALSEQGALEVRDTGPPVAPADAEQIFEAYGQGSPDGTDRGAGLELALSRQLARALGGDITLHPGQPTGAGFTVRLG